MKLAIDKPCSDQPERFCIQVGLDNRMAVQNDSFTVKNLADQFRRAFQLDLSDDIALRHGVVTQLIDLLNELDISYYRFTNIIGLDGCFDYSSAKEKWQIQVRVDAGKREPLFILHELFEIVFWRCSYLIDWWSDWVNQSCIFDPHDVADEFALAVIYPDVEFPGKFLSEGLLPCKPWLPGQRSLGGRPMRYIREYRRS